MPSIIGHVIYFLLCELYLHSSILFLYLCVFILCIYVFDFAGLFSRSLLSLSVLYMKNIKNTLTRVAAD